MKNRRATILGLLALAVACRGTPAARACESPGDIPASVQRESRRELEQALKTRAAQASPKPRGLSPAQGGQWHLVEDDSQILAVHAVLLPSGKILYVAGSGNDHNYRLGVNQARLFDPAGERVLGMPEFAGADVPANTPATLHDNDLFCAGHSLLPDGRVLFAGGNLEYPTGWVHRLPGVPADLRHDAAGYDHPLPYDNPQLQRPACHGFLGLRESFLFDAQTGTWQRGPRMQSGRWYPTSVALADGRVVVMHGLDDVGSEGCRTNSNRTVEVFDPATESWSVPRAYPGNWPNDLYPYVHLLPSGHLFYAGPDQVTRVFDPQTLATIGSHQINVRGYRDYGTSTLLPLRPQDGYRPRVLNTGGVVRAGQVPTNASEIIDLSASVPRWQSAAPMLHGRVNAPSVLLPDGRLLVVGGGAIRDEMGEGVLEAEIYDPHLGSWTPAAEASVERHYHSVALLLPDGRVWVAGSNPKRNQQTGPDPYNPQNECADSDDPCHATPFDAHGNNELRIEIYSPPYLFAGPRLQIAGASPSAAYGDPITVQMADAAQAGAVAKAVLVRLGSTTHSRNMDQRLVELVPITGALSAMRALPAAETLAFAAPPSGALAPPGYYMLFVLDGAGVPSVATMVRLHEHESCPGSIDLDGDTIGNPCDPNDAGLVLRRALVRGTTGGAAADGRMRFAGEAVRPAGAPLLDGSGGLALRFDDGAMLDVRMALDAQECSSCGSDCTRCRSNDGRLRIKMRRTASPESVRFSLRGQGLAIASPSGSSLRLTLSDDPGIAVAGVDWSGEARDCRSDAHGISCR